MSSHKVDIFRLLSAIDRRDKGFYDSLSEEERASIPMVVVARWLSGVGDNTGLSEYHLEAVNKIVNDGFWGLYKHPKLQYLLMTTVGSGNPVRHEWIAQNKKTKKNPVRDLIISQYPQANDMELDILVSTMTMEEFYEIAYKEGWDEKDIRATIKNFFPG